jgi:thiamine biosynthesis lipoprotein
MGSDAHVIVVDGPPDALETARARIEQLERLWSRFLPDSEVSDLNRHPGEAREVSDETRLLIAKAVEAWAASGGAFDPTVLGSLVAAGYDRSFELIDDETSSPAVDLPTSLALVGCTDIELDGTSVKLPAGTGFDPGGIGKGLAADLVVEELRALGAAGACVNLGGDLRVSGEGPHGGPWIIDIEAPGREVRLARVSLTEGAVATSTTLRRRWGPGGERHHLIDVTTGEPSATDLELATVVAGAAWLAEVHAKTVLLRGAPHQFDLVDGTGPEALSVDRHGYVCRTPGMAGFLVDEPVGDQAA